MPDRPASASDSRSANRTSSKRRPASAGRRSGGSGKSPSTERGRRTRERIIRAATELFSTRGFATTRVEDVLRASGTGKSQFYHYFEDKTDLGRAVLRYQRSQTIPSRNPAFGHLDSWDRIAAWFDDILRAATRALLDPHDSIGTFSFEFSAATEPLHEEFARTASLRRRLLHRGLRRMQRRGDLRNDTDPERLASFAAAAIEGGLRFARDEGSPEPLRHALGETFAHLRGYASQSPQAI